ncbi:putative chemotaxis MCP methyltransferase CheR [Candidatus Nitrososphaera gargensis Ga9.2]|uniref:protein-glutamate O-methyltransferase n=1 Tax=Nitrososphaera gargensis (strain Ga9.2) TaxID=1237085 RepID=K0IIN3_NITGG|nr:protein-glutamate O-methyltransferase CheR [Candidatus Nitrososphaera gargensis]AFU57957.1 putative chemotaxis MCP methyltransferase CheR [Candidatus Nitrososphaera gargensis Ga9.2]
MSSIEKSADPNLDLILNRLADSGDAQKYRKSFLIRRIDHRMRAKGIRTYQEYAKLLSNDPVEHATLTSLFSVTVTEFFRDIQLFHLLRTTLLPSMVHSNRITKIWCAGCATGEEPYSVALVASELLQTMPGSHRLSVFATDINPNSIRFARSGIYEERNLKNISDEIKSKYFQQVTGKKSWQISPQIREAIIFNVGDLAKVAPPASDLDMILCRNVMIYFDKESRERLLKKFYDALKPKGYLIMGQSEIMIGRTSSLFKTIYTRERVYQKS